MKPFELFISEIGSNQLHITAAIKEDTFSVTEITENLYRELTSILNSSSMQIMHERVFGSLEFYGSFSGIRRKYFDFAEGGFSYIQGDPYGGRELAGIQIHAVKPASTNDYWMINADGVPCGHGWMHNGITYIHLTGLTDFESGIDNRAEQASLVFEKINQLLVSQSIGFCNVARLWIYLEDILEWYDEFNAVRTEKFKTFGLMPQSIIESEVDRLYLPASTGIGGRNPTGSAVLADVLAISGDIQASVLPGVSQRSAYRYGSAFSRGVYVRESDYGWIFVSGTAAIDEQGTSLYPMDVEKQIIVTIETIESLIAEKGAKLTDICSATVYLKKAEDLSIYKRVAAKFGLERMPAICVVADICRDELLFEMDAIAVASNQSAVGSPWSTEA